MTWTPSNSSVVVCRTLWACLVLLTASFCGGVRAEQATYTILVEPSTETTVDGRPGEPYDDGTGGEPIFTDVTSGHTWKVFLIRGSGAGVSSQRRLFRAEFALEGIGPVRIVDSEGDLESWPMLFGCASETTVGDRADFLCLTHLLF